MTTWSIQYSDEQGNQNTRTTDDIGEVHTTLEAIVNDWRRTTGYTGHTATWTGYSPRIESNPDGVGNWTLDVVNLDTHTPDGYTIEEATEMQAAFYGGDVPMTDAERDMVQRDAENDGNWSLGLEDDSDPLENKTESFTLEAPTGKTNYSVVVSMEADMPTAPMMFEQCAHGAPCTCASVSAQNAARMATGILSGTGEPLPLRATHEDYRTVYRASGFHDLFGEWSVDLIAYDRGEICGTCGEWFADSDAWGEHNDMAHY